jgi:hypothetical protein
MGWRDCVGHRASLLLLAAACGSVKESDDGDSPPASSAGVTGASGRGGNVADDATSGATHSSSGGSAGEGSAEGGAAMVAIGGVGGAQSGSGSTDSGGASASGANGGVGPGASGAGGGGGSGAAGSSGGAWNGGGSGGAVAGNGGADAGGSGGGVAGNGGADAGSSGGGVAGNGGADAGGSGGGVAGHGGSNDGGSAGSPGDACDGVTCWSPPASHCLGGTLRSYASVGTCSDGVCAYAHADGICAFGCANGACLADPCLGVSCDLPPPPYCVDSDTVRTYESTGTCAQGSCSYTNHTSTCAFGCSSGACNGDPCLGVVCNSPPAPTCLDADTRLTYSSPGVCSGGLCSYPSTQAECSKAGATGMCGGGNCTVSACMGRWYDVDGKAENGCEHLSAWNYNEVEAYWLGSVGCSGSFSNIGDLQLAVDRATHDGFAWHEAAVGAHGLYFEVETTGGGPTCSYGYEVKVYQLTGTGGCYELKVDADVDSSCVPQFSPPQQCSALVFSKGYSKGDVIRFSIRRICSTPTNELAEFAVYGRL